MESQLNQSVVIIIFFAAAIGLYLWLERRIEKQFLTGEERIKIKAAAPNYFGLIIIFVPMLFSIVFKEIFGFGNNFYNTARFSLWLIIFLLVFRSQFTRMSKIKLPEKFVEKWRRLNFAAALAVILFMTVNLLWSFVRWQNDGYRLFPTE